MLLLSLKPSKLPAALRVKIKLSSGPPAAPSHLRAIFLAVPSLCLGHRVREAPSIPWDFSALLLWGPLVPGLPCALLGRLWWALNPQRPREASWAGTINLEGPGSCLWPRLMAPHSTPRHHVAGCTPTFSPVMAKGALNHCSKVLQLLKMVGSRKLRSAQSSGSLFCSGVPVSSRRRGAT